MEERLSDTKDIFSHDASIMRDEEFLERGLMGYGV